MKICWKIKFKTFGLPLFSLPIRLIGRFYFFYPQQKFLPRKKSVTKMLQKVEEVVMPFGYTLNQGRLFSKAQL